MLLGNYLHIELHKVQVHEVQGNKLACKGIDQIMTNVIHCLCFEFYVCHKYLDTVDSVSNPASDQPCNM